MIRSTAGKAMWVGRTTAAVIGLAIALAVVFGVATMALAAVPGDPFKLGQVNSINRLSTLVGTATSPMLRVENKGSSTALNLKVQPGKPPLTVNSTGRVPKLNSDKLDGKDASAFGIRTKHSFSYVHECDTPNTWNECAPVEVTVPAGKRYLVSVWSSFTAGHQSTSNQTLAFCSAKKNPGQSVPSCITPFEGAPGEETPPSKVTIPVGQFGAAASSGETRSLSEGTYVFSTAILPAAQFGITPSGQAITKVLVRDAAGATVTSASVAKLDAPSRER